MYIRVIAALGHTPGMFWLERYAGNDIAALNCAIRLRVSNRGPGCRVQLLGMVWAALYPMERAMEQREENGVFPAKRTTCLESSSSDSESASAGAPIQHWLPEVAIAANAQQAKTVWARFGCLMSRFLVRYQVRDKQAWNIADREAPIIRSNAGPPRHCALMPERTVA